MRVTVLLNTYHHYKSPSDGSLRVLVVRRREGGREGEVVLREGVNAVATEGMLGDLNRRGGTSDMDAQKEEGEV